MCALLYMGIFSLHKSLSLLADSVCFCLLDLEYRPLVLVFEIPTAF